MQHPIKNLKLWPQRERRNGEFGDISQYFGENPQFYSQWGLRGHEGIDLTANGKPDQNIYSMEDGIVVRDEDNRYADGPGIYLTIWNPATNRAWLYGHMEYNNFKVGDTVRQGQIIGKLGNTGNSTGPHLHLALLQTNANGNRINVNNGFNGFIDPLPFLEQVNRPMSNNFHIQNEEQLNDWLQKWGIARLQEMNNLQKEGYGYNIFELYAKIDSLKDNIFDKEKKESLEEVFNNQENQKITTKRVSGERIDDKQFLLYRSIYKTGGIKELVQTMINDLKYQSELINMFDELKKGKEELMTENTRLKQELAEEKENFKLNKLFIGISKWLTKQGGLSQIIYTALSILIGIAPTFIEMIPPESSWAAAIPLLTLFLSMIKEKTGNDVELNKKIEEIERAVTNKNLPSN